MPSKNSPDNNLYAKMREILKDVNEWLKYAEAKNAVALTLSLALFGAMLRIIVDEQDRPELFWSAAVTCGFLLCTIGIALFSFLARLTPPRTKLHDVAFSPNVFYYKDLSKLDEGQIKDQVLAAFKSDPIEYTVACAKLGQQVVYNSRIAVLKFRCFNWAAWFFAIALAATVITYTAGSLIFCNDSQRQITKVDCDK